MALVPQIVDAVSLPVIAAGGIGDGRGIAAAFALGASGVQMGTAFSACPEAATGAQRRTLLSRAKDSDTLVTDAISGRCARACRSDYAADMADLSGRWPPYGAMYTLSGPIEAASAKHADEPLSFHLYGQAAGLSREMPAAELMQWLVGNAQSCMRNLRAP